MKKLFTFCLILFSFNLSFAQRIGDYTLEIEELSFQNIPALQSFVVGTHEDDWLIIGGRTDGLHRRQPWVTFWEEDNNQNLYVINPVDEQVWSYPLNSLSTPLFEQLQSANMEYCQRNNTLYVIGGYGYSATADDHVTFPYLTAVDVEATIAAIKNGETPSAHFRQIELEAMRVTGGQLGLLDNRFYLVGGQKFMGRYNPHGPDHGPGFVQEYTNQIRSFNIADDGQTLSIDDYQSITDTAVLHRRDYNLVEQIFPDGSRGYIAFSGVFRYDQDLPWLNVVDIDSKGYQEVPGFEQLLNHYHTAHLAAFDAEKNEMNTVFFGGIAQFYFDENSTLMEDQNVPFVPTISCVTRDAQGTWTEAKIGEMAALLGASAEFIPANNESLFDRTILLLNELSEDRILVGYVFGGIESSAANIFFVNDGTQSVASNKIYAIYLNQQTVAVSASSSWKNSLQIFPNPTKNNQFTLYFELGQNLNLSIILKDNSGKTLQIFTDKKAFGTGTHQFELQLKNYPPGVYYLMFSDGTNEWSEKVVIP